MAHKVYSGSIEPIPASFKFPDKLGDHLLEGLRVHVVKNWNGINDAICCLFLYY